MLFPITTQFAAPISDLLLYEIHSFLHTIIYGLDLCINHLQPNIYVTNTKNGNKRFFIKNMVNESLGTICNAHVVHADRSVYGAMDEKCLKLKQGELKEKLKLAYNTLRKEFRNVFEHMDSGFDQLSDNEKNTVYKQKVLAWYQVTYHPSWMKRSPEFQEPDGVSETVMLSFPWIAADYLARIKVKFRGIGRVNSTKPSDSLVRYLADRI